MELPAKRKADDDKDKAEQDHEQTRKKVEALLSGIDEDQFQQVRTSHNGLF
ncbi:hypothetical protein [Bradyrhizobium sp. RT4b]|uniref:hypothetical protein n=1 Tax=Bradyrhizobium sp. RT4b TaxID=3156379 RepID=UPI003396318D